MKNPRAAIDFLLSGPKPDWRLAWPVALVVGAATLASLNEFACSDFFLLLSSVSCGWQIWKFPGQRVAVRTLLTMALVTVLACAGAVVNEFRAEKPWSQLPSAWRHITHAQSPDLPALRELFDSDFNKQYPTFNGAELTLVRSDTGASYTIPTKLMMDFSLFTKSVFLAFYIGRTESPTTDHDSITFECEYPALHFHEILESLQWSAGVGSSIPGDTDKSLIKDLKLSAIYLYVEDALSPEQLAEIDSTYAKQGLSVTVRGLEYRQSIWFEQRRK